MVAIVPCDKVGDWIRSGLFLHWAHVIKLHFDKQLPHDGPRAGRSLRRRNVDALEQLSTSSRESHASQRTQLFPLKLHGIHDRLGLLAANPLRACKVHRVARSSLVCVLLMFSFDAQRVNASYFSSLDKFVKRV